jgi:hypothetical protein
MSKLIFTLAILFLLLPQIASADGIIIPPPDRYAIENSQKAVIFYDKGVETLILSITFTGNAKDFAWVIPTPSQPEVDKSSNELFLSLEELTEPPAPQWGRSYDLEAGLTEKEAVEILEEKEVGIYEVKILAASDADALAEWLSENGYQFPEKGGYILEDYVKNKWYYTAVKLRPELVWPDIEEKLQTGQAMPLELVFESEKIIYPLKITSLSSLWESPAISIRRLPSYPEDQAGILLYVFADSQKRVPGFESLYAEIIKAEEIEELAYDDEGNSWIETKKDFVLTKLYREMKFSQMTDDLILRDEAGGKKNEEESIIPLNPIEELESRGLIKNLFYIPIALIIWIISPIGLIFLICALILFTAKSRFPRFLAWAGQIFTIFAWGSAMFFLIIARSRPFQENIFQLDKDYIDAGIWSGLILIFLMFIIILVQIFYRQKIKEKEEIKEKIESEE